MKRQIVQKEERLFLFLSRSDYKTQIKIVAKNKAEAEAYVAENYEGNWKLCLGRVASLKEIEEFELKK